MCSRTSAKLFSLPVSRLSMTSTVPDPSASSVLTSAEPMKPAPPVTTYFLMLRPSAPRQQAIQAPPDPDRLIEQLQRRLMDALAAQQLAEQPPGHRADLVELL